jgi:EAL domain-containing protein (putative c-di-GMP-specific phosphodiesterase class I)
MNHAVSVLDAPPAIPAIDAVDAYLGRQPIVDRGGQLVGYELLYRGADRAASNVAATSDVVVNLLNGAGFADSLGRFPGNINVCAEFLLSDMVELLSPASVVLEILESVRATPELMARIGELRTRGFSFALDDFTAETADNAPFLDVVDFIKVDILAVPEESLGALVRGLHGRRGKLLAEKVEDARAFERCVELGFELFQGYHFARPQVLRPRSRISAGRGERHAAVRHRDGRPKSRLQVRFVRQCDELPCESIHRQRPAEVIALHALDALVGQKPELIGGFDALGDHADLERPRESHDGAHDAQAVAVAG